MMSTKNLLIELFVEELPPKALKKLGEAFAATLAASLKAARPRRRRRCRHVIRLAAPARRAPHRRRRESRRQTGSAEAHAGRRGARRRRPADARPAEEACRAGSGRLGSADAQAPARRQGRSPVPRQHGSRRHAGRRPAGGAGSRAGRAADPQGDDLPAGRRLEQREFRASGAQAGRAAWRRCGADLRARPPGRPRDAGPSLRGDQADRRHQGCRLLRAATGKRRCGDRRLRRTPRRDRTAAARPPPRRKACSRSTTTRCSTR